MPHLESVRAAGSPLVVRPPGVVLIILGCLSMLGGLRLRRRFAAAA